MNAHGILVVGGYGVVGGRIAADLAPDYPDRVIVAGRDLEANAAATAIGHGVRGRAIDVTLSSHATLLGHAQADAAAAGASGVLRALLDGAVAKPGAWMPEQVIDPGPFLERLAARGLSVNLALVPKRQQV